jgi:SAM-dependent methyltransferase
MAEDFEKRVKKLRDLIRGKKAGEKVPPPAYEGIKNLIEYRKAVDRLEERFPFPSPAAGEAMRSLSEHYEIDAPVRYSSHRKIIGRFLVAMRRFLRPFIYGVFAPYIERQREFNLELVRALNKLVSDLTEQLNRLKDQTTMEAYLSRLSRGMIDRMDLIYSRLDGSIITLENIIEEMKGQLAALSRFEEEAGRDISDLKMGELSLTKKMERVLAELKEALALGGKERKKKLSKVVKEKEGLSDHYYYTFETRHRGAEEEIKNRQRVYLKYFHLGDRVIDLGCGRGEFLLLLKEEGIEGYGIDLNEEMLLSSREKGLKVVKAEAVSHLESIPPGKITGIFASQLIEHLPPDIGKRLVELAFEKLPSGGRLILETINPGSLFALSRFFTDFSHIRPIHPEALRFIYQAAGFSRVEVIFLSPVAEEEKLEPLTPPPSLGEPIISQFARLNNNIRRLNDILYGPQDYAVIGEK